MIFHVKLLSSTLKNFLLSTQKPLAAMSLQWKSIMQVFEWEFLLLKMSRSGSFRRKKGLNHGLFLLMLSQIAAVSFWLKDASTIHKLEYQIEFHETE